jgi:dihydrofolate reductase
MIVSILVAAAENGVIGRDNQLPWHLQADLRRFRKLTMGHHVFMGRKTFDSIGKRPLTGRPTIVITRQSDYLAPGATVVRSIEEAIARSAGDSEVFNLGGADIFAQSMPQSSRIYLTRIHATIEGDVRFPFIDPREWRLVNSEAHKADEQNDYPVTFEDYERIQKE